jgi:hypothetical protein
MIYGVPPGISKPKLRGSLKASLIENLKKQEVN